MSKPRYDWWPYVKGMIRRYPALWEKYRNLHSQSITADYSGMPRLERNSRTVERAALRELPSTQQREYEAVKRAVEETKRYPNGVARLKMIELVFWEKGYTLEGAALKVPCGRATAWRWHGEFIRLVASHYGLMDED